MFATDTENEIVDLTTDELGGEIATLYSRISAETCRWLLLVAEFDRREAYRKAWGARNMADWLSWHCGIGLRAAHEHVRVARRLTELPLTTEVFARGELSYSKVRAISRVADEHTEESLVGLARDATGAQLERIASSYRRARARDDETLKVHERFASWFVEDDGSLSLRARFSPEEAAVIKKALEIAGDEIRSERSVDCDHAEHGRDETYEKVVTNADAMVRLAESMLAEHGAKASGGDATQVVVHVDLDALSDDPDANCRCDVEGELGIPTATASRLACDASVVTLIERAGEPLSVGRKTRSIPPAVRRAMNSRDGGCRFPGCSATRFIDGHHVEHWARGGETSLENLISLCRHHHRLLHEGGFQVEPSGEGQFIFRRPNGSRLTAAPPLPGWSPRRRRALPVPEWADPVGTQGLKPLGACAPRDGRQKLDLELTIWALCANRELKIERELATAQRE